MIWGSSFILIKKSLLAFSPFQVGMARICISALFMLPILIKYRTSLYRQNLKHIIIVGLTGTAIPSVLFPLAQEHVDSSTAGVLNSLTPLFTFLLGVGFFGLRYSGKRFFGVIIGLIGAIILVLGKNQWSVSQLEYYALFILLATICYAISVNTVGKHLQNVNTMLITSLSLFLVGIPAAIILFNTDFLTVLQHHDQAWLSLGSVSILAIFGTALSSLVFFYLVQKTDAIFGSSVAYLIPIVALLLGMWDGEDINIWVIVGMILILAGVYLSKKNST